MHKPTHLLIDGDIYLYEATTATERAVDYGNDNWVLSANLVESKELFKLMIDQIVDDIDPDASMTICLSDAGNFRKQLSDTYKSQRKAQRKPLIFPELKQWVMETYGTLMLPNLEADDVMGIMATTPMPVFDYIIVSTDKDLQTIPGKLYRQGKVVTITEQEADAYWLTQALTGDTTDGYKGCPGCGPVGAKKALGSVPSWSAVLQTYQKAGLTYDEALLNTRFARILRASDWDHDKQAVKLWEPANG